MFYSSIDEFLAKQMQREFDREQELQYQFEKSKANGGVARAIVGQDSYNYFHENEEELEDSSDDDEDFRELATNMLYSMLLFCYNLITVMFQITKSLISLLAGLKKKLMVIELLQNMIKKLLLPRIVNEPCTFLLMFKLVRHNCLLLFLIIQMILGDVIGEKFHNKVFNHLKTHVKLEDKRQARLKDKDEKATSEANVDAQTRLILFKWINSQEIDRVDEVIATGKVSFIYPYIYIYTLAFQESAVLHASRGLGTSSDEHYAIKVYKMTLDNFKNRVEYVKDDFRFKNPRRVMKVWAEKEHLNLKRLNRAGIRCPKPIQLKKHVLLMSMIGDTEAAPRLKNVIWCDEELKTKAFEQVQEVMKRMFKECKLVCQTVVIIFIEYLLHFF